MRKVYAVCALAVVMSLAMGSAGADWRVVSVRNQMTDREDKVASVSAKNSAGGVEARLQIECLDDRLVGGLLVSIVLSAPLPAQFEIGVNYRIDERPVDPRVMRIGSSLRSVTIHGLSVDELRSAKRFRVELFPKGVSPLFFDFDVGGADKAIRAVPCRSAR